MPWTALGIAILLLAWFWPFPQHSFTGHMVSHMTVVAITAPLAAIGISGSRLDPVLRYPQLFSPLLMSVLEFFVVWLWHMPKMHEAAMMFPAVALVEQTSFLVSGLGLWISILGGTANERQTRYAKGIAALLLTLMHMTLLGAVLALSPRPLYAMTTRSDQEWGGVIMLVWGAIAYCTGGLWLAAALLLNARTMRLLRQQPDPDLQYRR
jgi:putative membrane protein